MRRDPNRTSGEPIVHPGKTVEEVINEAGMTEGELSVRTGMAIDQIQNLIAGTADISADIAKRLEFATGIDCEYWMRLQSVYDRERVIEDLPNSITDTEWTVFNSVKDEVTIMQENGIMYPYEDEISSLLDLRRVMHVWNLTALQSIADNDIVEYVRNLTHYLLESKKKHDELYHSKKKHQ